MLNKDAAIIYRIKAHVFSKQKVDIEIYCFVLKIYRVKVLTQIPTTFSKISRAYRFRAFARGGFLKENDSLKHTKNAIKT